MYQNVCEKYKEMKNKKQKQKQKNKKNKNKNKDLFPIPRPSCLESKQLTGYLHAIGWFFF